ncbi:MAG: hypothetical protein J0H74_19125 [Chitinophagaceae bacterium]|nr:hypothetical protein [Chitinophagaceae bacterium]
MNTIEQKLVKASGKYVTTEHVDTLIRNYKKERWLQNSERIGKEDTLGLWLTTDELEEFIQTAKLHGANSIRVCFGVYGEKGGRPGMEGKQTVALVAASGEGDDPRSMVFNDVYVERNGSSSLLAYNVLYPETTPTGPVNNPPHITLGAMMVADKEKGLHVI